MEDGGGWGQEMAFCMGVWVCGYMAMQEGRRHLPFVKARYINQIRVDLGSANPMLILLDPPDAFENMPHDAIRRRKFAL